MLNETRSDYAVLEIGRELWIARPEPSDWDLKFRGPFRSSAEVTVWINKEWIARRAALPVEISRPAFSA
jgi:hypothetical protein